MRILTHQLSGRSLDWAVARSMGWKVETWHSCGLAVFYPNAPRALPFAPSANWAQVGLIANEHEISIDYRDNETLARKWNEATLAFIETRAQKRQGLVAAMRCLVLASLGAEVDVPDELLKDRV